MGGVGHTRHQKGLWSNTPITPYTVGEGDMSGVKEGTREEEGEGKRSKSEDERGLRRRRCMQTDRKLMLHRTE